MSGWFTRLSNVFVQSFFIPAPPLTPENLGDQTGKVFIVTGGYSGVGFELTKALYAKNGVVYIAGRSVQKAALAIADIEDEVPRSDGRLEFIKLDLGDLATIKKSAEDFLKREQRLDVLVNNAGVMVPQQDGSTTEEGYELQIGTNCLGPYLFTQLLLPILQKTAAISAPNSVRVTWAASVAIDFAPEHGMAWNDKKKCPVNHANSSINYAQSKAGNLFLASEFARRLGRDTGIVSVAYNPGNLRTELYRHANVVAAFLFQILLYPAKLGACTELFAGWSPSIGQHNSGCLVVPWGRVFEPRQGLQQAIRLNYEGGYGLAERFWDWCDRETKRWMQFE
ncbi:Short-chain dehydrogenase [Neofusicoccum parvum]|uniref:Short-chain dehydrogenase n=1 Tax=Neofusicoccum parvum TaxID=310453 RepID=A0ACB5S0G6_9PEZI|nr:Short-chain dehydrogenase [Neofusicoccum parvum]GME37127.1 Short-chain dehydrogenase [Neofusicoccum parvum]